MKAGIHPHYEECNVICACGHTFRTDAERTEQYDPEGDGPSVICCQPCGTAHGYESV